MKIPSSKGKYFQLNHRRKEEAFRTLNRLDQKRNSSCHIIIKTPSIQNKERILKEGREKGQITYKVRPIRISPDISTEIVKARRSLGRYHTDPKRTQMTVQANILSKTLNDHLWKY